jgi:hypothetical protein
MMGAIEAMKLIVSLLLIPILAGAVVRVDPKHSATAKSLIEVGATAMHASTSPVQYATIGANGAADGIDTDAQKTPKLLNKEKKWMEPVRKGPSHLSHRRLRDPVLLERSDRDTSYLGSISKSIFPSRRSTVLVDMFKSTAAAGMDPPPQPPVDTYTDMEGNPNIGAVGDTYGIGYGDEGYGTDGVVDDDVDVSVGSEVISAKGSLEVPDMDTWTLAPEPTVWAVGEGVGSLAYDRSPTDSRTLNRELRERLQVQDYATIGVVLTVFAMTILVSLSSIYKVSEDPSPVRFYTDPKYPQRRCLCSSLDSDAFLQAFNGQPQSAKLRIIGKRPEEEAVHSLLFQARWFDAVRRMREVTYEMFDTSRDARHLARHWDAVLFDVTLDLTPFIQGEGQLRSEDDQIELQKYLANQSNALELIVLRKHVEWPQWEDIATNIKQRLRQTGFNGDLEIHLEDSEDLIIFRNDPWQNFVRSRITQALIVISVVGAFFWVPYLWARNKKRTVHTYFQIGLDIERYWELFSQGLHPVEGFTTATH